MDMVSRGGRPLPQPDGSGKRGRWEFREDGSGQWTRIDAVATNYRPLLRAGPLREEVVSRVTYDGRTGEQLGPVMFDYSVSKHLCEPLPEPTPRPLRTVFSFAKTSVEVPPECRNTWRPASGGDDTSKSPACSASSIRRRTALASLASVTPLQTIARMCS